MIDGGGEQPWVSIAWTHTSDGDFSPPPDWRIQTDNVAYKGVHTYVQRAVLSDENSPAPTSYWETDDTIAVTVTLVVLTPDTFPDMFYLIGSGDLP